MLWTAPFHSVDPWSTSMVSASSTKDGIMNPYSLRKHHRNTWQITLTLSHASRMIKHKHQPIIPWIFHHLKTYFIDLQTHLDTFCVHSCLYYHPTKPRLNSSPMAHGCRSIWWGLGVKPVWQSILLHTFQMVMLKFSNSRVLHLLVAPLILLNVTLLRSLSY